MKNITILSLLFLAVLVLSGCGVANSPSADTTYAINTILKTTDGGVKWGMVSKDNQSKMVIIPEIFSLEIDPANSQILYAGTEKDGLFISKDGGDSWKKIDFPLLRIYGLAISQSNSSIIYASGILNDRGKAYRTENGGKDWKEIYSEPANGTVISSLGMDPRNSDVVYIGTFEGMIIKTVDGGKTWKNVNKAEGPVTAISFDAADSATAYFAILNSEMLRTRDGGVKFDNLGEKLDVAGLGREVFSLLADPSSRGTLYVGLSNGLLKGTDFGNKFEPINVLESSKSFPIRAISINPKNSSELIYNSAQAIYKSVDAGKQWSTYQLDTVRSVFQFKYDTGTPSTIYLGLRKIN